VRERAKINDRRLLHTDSRTPQELGRRAMRVYIARSMRLPHPRNQKLLIWLESGMVRSSSPQAALGRRRLGIESAPETHVASPRSRSRHTRTGVGKGKKRDLAPGRARSRDSRRLEICSVYKDGVESAILVQRWQILRKSKGRRNQVDGRGGNV
jgi:hypothetical protein